MKGRYTVRLDALHKKSPEDIAREVLLRAASVNFPIDPLIGLELSRSFSIVNSVIRRHGFEIQAGLARALVESSVYNVFTNVPVDLPGRIVPSRKLSLDVVAINQAQSWIGGYEVKRGLGGTETAKRVLLEEDLLAIRNVLPEVAAKLGYSGMKVATTGIIQYYSVAKFNERLTLRRADLDDHFEVPVASVLDSITDAIASELKRAVPLLFGVSSGAPGSAQPPVAALRPHDRPLGPSAARRAAVEVTARSRRPLSLLPPRTGARLDT